jgi:hypothetical protein
MLKIGYKVVWKSKSKLGSQLFSCRMRPTLYLWSGATVKYGIGAVSKPKNKNYGPLTIFKELGAAKKFCNAVKHFRGEVVYLCIYIPSKRKYVALQEGNVAYARELPDGTDFAEEVVLIKKVGRKVDCAGFDEKSIS